jgi:hypothetical protein
LSNKKKAMMNRDMEKQAAELLGKHVSKEKGRILLVVTLIACALPMILGARLWGTIPATVHTGLIGTDGSDDSIPRVMVAFGLPALMCLLDLIAHFMLAWNQKQKTVPPGPSRLVGRWGFPIISVLFCSGMILEAVGETLSLPFMTPCIVGLALLLLGSHVWDCKKDAKIALRFSYTESSEAVWKSTNRFAGWLWMIGGLVIIAGAMLTSSSTWITAILVVICLVAPLPYAKQQASHLS